MSTLDTLDAEAEKHVFPPLEFSAKLADTILSQSPRHALEVEAEPSKLMDIGNAAHLCYLGKGPEIVPIDAPDFRTKDAQIARDRARAEGKTPILKAMLPEIHRMVGRGLEQLAQHPKPTPFTTGEAEVTLRFKLDGLDCRATPDWRHTDNKTLDDLKTTSGSAHPAAISRTLWDKGWAVQAALYCRGVKVLFGTMPDFRFIVQETFAPYALSVVSLDPEAWEFANMQLDEALRIWKRCLATNQWPAYPTRTAFAEVPGWMKTAWELRPYYEVGA